MKFVCGRCELSTTGKAYRVVSRESGILYLNFIVCHACYTEAKTLGLEAHEIGLKMSFLVSALTERRVIQINLPFSILTLRDQDWPDGFSRA